ncbi:MAG: thioredoxin domain-containing protein [Promethearchaeota archaeon]
MAGKVVEYLNGISEKEFNDLINSNENVLVDCFAEWCGPCKMMSPILAELSVLDEYQAVRFVKIDTDNCDWINYRFNIDSIPRFLFFKKGKLIHEQRGASSKELFEYTIKKHLLNVKFDTFHEYESISEDEFESLIKSKKMLMVYLYKKGSQLNDIFEPTLVLLSDKYDKEGIYFASIDVSNSKWLLAKFNLKDEEYLKFGDPEKKLPYFLLYNEGKLVHETGPVQDFEFLLKKELLKNFKFENIDKEISEDDFNALLKQHEKVVFYVTKPPMLINTVFMPLIDALAEKYTGSKFIILSYDKNPWLEGKFGISNQEYTQFEESGKKLPYFLVFKNGEKIGETAPLQNMDAYLSQLL